MGAEDVSEVGWESHATPPPPSQSPPTTKGGFCSPQPPEGKQPGQAAPALRAGLSATPGSWSTWCLMESDQEAPEPPKGKAQGSFPPIGNSWYSAGAAGQWGRSHCSHGLVAARAPPQKRGP